MKRTLSLVLALVMVLGTFTMAFADMTDAEMEAGALLEDLGVLEGDGEGNLYLDVELKRQDAVVLLSRLMDQEEIAKNFPVEDEMYSDVEDSFYFGYLAWAKADGTFEGKGTGEFGFDDVIDAKSYAKVLLTALGYEQDVDFEYEEVLEFANEKGIVAVDENGNVTRGTMAVMTVEALAVEMKDGSMTLAEKLEITMPEEPVVEATKVESVYAENLKEVVVVFDGEVDAMTAEDEFNYSTTAGDIDTAVLSEDMTMVTLTLVDGKVMTNQKEYTVTVSGVKAGDAKISAEKVKFTPIDNSLPTVVEIKSLGTKAIKVIVSEPVNKANVSSFKLDGKSYFGTSDVSGRVITLKPYNSSSTLKAGDHTLTTAKIEDFYGLKSLEQENEFVVVEDNDAPVVVEVKATLEKAVVEFDEDIDPDTVTKNSFYWKSGSVKKYPRTATVTENKVELDFTNNPLPAYETKLFINGVADYSGNKLSDAEVSVTALVDQTRPEVIDVRVSKDAKSITVRFNKNVDGLSRSNYVVKDDENENISVKSITRVNSDSDREFNVSLYKTLPAGLNTLTISGIADKTTLKNVMLPQTFDLNVGDLIDPESDEFTVTADGRRIIVTFDKAMDLASISEPNNYLIKVNGIWTKMPAETEFTPILNGKGIRIILPEYIDEDANTKYDAGTTVTGIQLMALKDSAGNVMMPTVQSYVVSKELAKLDKYDTKVTDNVYAALTDSKTIKIRFTQAIGEVKANGIKVENSAGTVLGANVTTNESNLVTVELNNSVGTAVYGGNIEKIIIDGSKIVTITGGEAQDETIIPSNMVDRVKPEVDVKKLDNEENVKVITQATKDSDGKATSSAVMELEFTEAITGGANAAFDLEITRISDNETLTPITDYTVSYNGKKLMITVNQSAVKDSAYTVKVKANASFLQDDTTAANKADESDTFETSSSLLEQ
jgi:hypothetical protein